MKRILGPIVLTLGVTALLTGLPQANATVLTFDSSGPLFEPLGNYGDRASEVGPNAEGFAYEEGNGFTPNVLMDYSITGPLYGIFLDNHPNWPGKVAYLWTDGSLNPQPPRPWRFVFSFTPDPTYGVRVNSFGLNNFGNCVHCNVAPPYHVIHWEVLAGTTVLAAGDASLVPGLPRDTIYTGLTDFEFGDVSLQIDVVNGGGNSLAVDNLNFDQARTPGTTVIIR